MQEQKNAVPADSAASRRVKRRLTTLNTETRFELRCVACQGLLKKIEPRGMPMRLVAVFPPAHNWREVRNVVALGEAHGLQSRDLGCPHRRCRWVNVFQTARR